MTIDGTRPYLSIVSESWFRKTPIDTPEPYTDDYQKNRIQKIARDAVGILPDETIIKLVRYGYLMHIPMVFLYQPFCTASPDWLNKVFPTSHFKDRVSIFKYLYDCTQRYKGKSIHYDYIYFRLVQQTFNEVFINEQTKHQKVDENLTRH